MSKVSWPKRAVVTAGMPYGNKNLHFGHVGGVFVPADCFARFLKDRIGAENVRFVSGTDCFGSPIDEGYRKLKESGKFDGTIEDYVMENHKSQVETLKKYDIDLSIFEGSGIGRCGEIHQELTNEVLQALYENDWLKPIDSKQFYDAQAGMFLNGRQVLGRCPVAGCKSENAYADECSLGHSYDPQDLIAPKSSVSGTVPEMKTVRNWYFDLPSYRKFLKSFVNQMRKDPEIREVVSNDIDEFLAEPIIFIKNECFDDYSKVKDNLPKHEYKEAEGNKQSFTVLFETIYDRDDAREVLTDAGIRFRTGKTLVPFRLTGNASWGVKSPDFDGQSEDLTVWCWPESLWAPISFTKAANEKLNSKLDWKDFWASKDSTVYQFIGQDNIYFYGVAQPALFDAFQNLRDGKSAKNNFEGLQQSRLVANHHVLFGNIKASSSGAVKPPSADELLDYYTSDQLRAHWLALGLAQKSVSFSPKPFDPDESKRNDPRVADPVLKEGTLLTNVFNRLARSCFYTAQKFRNCEVKLMPVDSEIKKVVLDTAEKYETLMHKTELYSVMQLMDEFIRYANKYWSDNAGKIEDNDEAFLDNLLSNSFYMLYAAALMMHPVVPKGCEKIAECMNIDADKFFNWEIFYNIDKDLFTGQNLKVKELPPRFDFFRKHESQFK